MSGNLVGELILWLIVAIVAIVIAVYIVNWLYHRSSKEVSFVRTGFLGERVVINGGAFVLPFIHDYTPVNMNVLPMGVVRSRQDAVITRDRMRVDIEADFYVRVQATARSRLDRRRDARTPHHGARTAPRAAFRQVRLGHPLRRLGNDDGTDARAARRICRTRQGQPPPRRWRRTGSSSNRSPSPTSTRPTSNTSIPRTASTPKV